LVLAVLLFATVAGCLNGPPEDPHLARQGDPDERAARVVVGIIDSGINAYHVQFRDNGTDAWRHPSLYIPGYPADAQALHIDLDATDWKAAVAADCGLWNGLEPDVLYWIPGTRIIGLRIAPDWVGEPVDCAARELPTKGLDTLEPHGSGAAGRAAGATTSLCPECKIVMNQGPQTTEAMHWMAQRPWIDVQSNSWGGYLCHEIPAQGLCDRGPHELARQATELQVTFAASGNGIRNNVGEPFALGLGTPAYLKPAQGHEGVIMVGGHDNGEIIVWPGSLPHVVADAWDHPSAAWNQTVENGTYGGTSGATPFAAGVFARLVLEARVILGDHGTGLRDGNVAVAAPDAQLPDQGPLADGILSREEAERLIMTTALERPREERPFDGELGCPLDSGYICVSRTNDLGPWSQVPDGVPAYYFIGYGQVGVRSLDAALAVLQGTAPQPERPVEDAFFHVDAQLRSALQE
jgi:hypothetical protein